jgi:hypothetical protein
MSGLKVKKQRENFVYREGTAGHNTWGSEQVENSVYREGIAIHNTWGSEKFCDLHLFCEAVFYRHL